MGSDKVSSEQFRGLNPDPNAQAFGLEETQQATEPLALRESSMVFSFHIFIFYFLFYFLPLALLLYYTMPQRGRNLLLTLVSYVFYGWANPLFVVLMLVSTTFDYVCGLFISNQFS